MREIWDLWFPEAGAGGLTFARTRVDADDAGDCVLVHAAAPVLDVTVRDEDGLVVAQGDGLRRADSGPMCMLRRRGDTIELADTWPDDGDIGRLVILPGGESGVLKSWRHAEDKSGWRWQLEFYNHT